MTLDELVEYYVNLLIIQYHNKPKARATIKAFIGQLLHLYVLIKEVEKAFNLNVAVGEQLDVVAKYFGAVRNFVGLEFATSYFSFQYIGGDDEGLTFNFIGNTGTGETKTLIPTKTYTYSLSDDQLRTLIKLRNLALHNDMLTYKFLDDEAFGILGNDVYIYSNRDMTLDFYIEDTYLLDIFRTYPSLLPTPAGVLARLHTMDRSRVKFTLRVLSYNNGTEYNAFQAGLETLENSISGKWQVLPEDSI